MRRLLVLVLVATATLFARPAFACRCAGNPTFRSAVHEAEVAFTGDVVRRDGDRYDVRVRDVVKGSVGRRVTLVSDPGTCGGAPPDTGPIAYAGGRDLHFEGCYGIWTGEYATRQASDLPTYPPDGDRDRGVPLIAAGVLLLAVAGLVLTRHRRASHYQPPTSYY